MPEFLLATVEKPFRREVEAGLPRHISYDFSDR